MKELALIRITPADGTLNEQFKALGDSYPKFHKMDALSKLGYLASEKLLGQLDEERFVSREDRAILLFSKHGCLDCDRKYLETMQGTEGYFPSPSLFVYSLPNIVAGEVAIRNRYEGETSFYLLDCYDETAMKHLAEECLQDSVTKSVLVGWLDYEDSEHFEAIMKIIE